MGVRGRRRDRATLKEEGSEKGYQGGLDLHTKAKEDLPDHPNFSDLANSNKLTDAVKLGQALHAFLFLFNFYMLSCFCLIFFLILLW